MTASHIPLKFQDTYIYIDVSNIRAACLRTLGFRPDFAKLIAYFQKKYPNLKDVRYYEGVATDDYKKQELLSKLKNRGYTICPLARKSYISSVAHKKDVKCPKCGHKWATKFVRKHKAMKSNVDVYLATELLTMAHFAKEPVHLILVSCDGDYAEAIKNAILSNKNVSVSVLATPPVKDFSKNTLSIRLKHLYRELPSHRYDLSNIATIRDYIS